MNEHEKYENILYKLAQKAYSRNEVPVSALIVYNNKIITKCYNQKNIKSNSLFHAEIMCIYKACKKLKRWNLEGCTMYVSLEPCDMCKNAIQEARLDKVYYLLNKGSITNKYDKTIYERLFVKSNKDFNCLLKTFFKEIRK